MDLTAAYTDARYTKDSRLSPDLTLPPIVANGDAIVGQGGQPGPPFTGSVGLEYRFNAFNHESFARADYQYVGAPKWNGPSQDPSTGQYDQANYRLSSTNFLTLRGGMDFNEWSGSLFVDNVTDSHPVANYDWSIDPGSLSGPNSWENRVQRNYTFRPRTFGLTLTYRH